MADNFLSVHITTHFVVFITSRNMKGRLLDGWKLYEFIYRVEHCPGVQHASADALSRRSAHSVVSP